MRLFCVLFRSLTNRMGPTHNSWHCVVLRVELAKCQSSYKTLQQKHSEQCFNTFVQQDPVVFTHTKKKFNHLLVLKGILNAIYWKILAHLKTLSFRFLISVNNGLIPIDAQPKQLGLSLNLLPLSCCAPKCLRWPIDSIPYLSLPL